MSSEVAQVAIHSSQFPEWVRQDLLQSLHTRKVNHKFHYDSLKQTHKWLALHQSYSPSRTDAGLAAAYDLAFAAAVGRVESPLVHLTGLGCGGGQKDARMLGLLKQTGSRVIYTPSDVSVAMVLVARTAALSLIDAEDCHPLVCDLETADDLATVLGHHTKSAGARIFTFFGMIPNFEPQLILPTLADLLRPADQLLFSANLAPGSDYEAGMRHILPQYDNELTRDWLMTFLLDLGVEHGDGDLRFSIEGDPVGSGVKRVAAYFHFSRARRIFVGDEAFGFRAGEAIRLFFSYRHTPDRVRALLEQHGLQITEQWIAKSGEEEVFLCQRAG